MTPRSVLRYETWTLQPDREPDAEPVLYAMQCAVDGETSPTSEDVTEPQTGFCGTAVRTRRTTPTGRSSPGPGGPGGIRDPPWPPKRRTALATGLPSLSGAADQGSLALVSPGRDGPICACCAHDHEVGASAIEIQPRRRVRRPITRHVCLAQPRTGISPVISIVTAPSRAQRPAFRTTAPPGCRRRTLRVRRAASPVPGRSAAERSDRGASDW